MTLSTLIHAGLVRPQEPTIALVLMGGGARTAYQAGVLHALAQMLGEAQPKGRSGSGLPFQLLVGTSAGALNASFLAARAQQGLEAIHALASFWRNLRSSDVYQLHLPRWARLSRITAAWQLARAVRERGALLDNLPLADTLHKAISLQGIDDGLESKALHTLAVTASSYSSGEHWTFCHRAHDENAKPWRRPGRRATFQQITMDHLMASSAIPLIFPAQALWVDGQVEFFGDGSMRQTSPLSPALHLGAHKILVIGVGQPQRSALAGAAEAPAEPGRLSAPGVGGVLGHALASVFHDTLHGDVEQALRMNDTLGQLPREVAAVLPYRQVQVLSIQPSASLDAVARTHSQALPSAVRDVLSTLSGQRSARGHSGAAALASYLLFEPSFTGPLLALGAQDALARRNDILAFLQA
jgi:NTE family protein